MTTFLEVRDLFHRNSMDHGWWDGVFNLPEKLCLIHSEISEMQEAYWSNNEFEIKEDGKPDGYVVELADVFIRAMDLCGYLGIDHYYQMTNHFTVDSGVEDYGDSLLAQLADCDEDPVFKEALSWVLDGNIDRMCACLNQITSSTLEFYRKKDDQKMRYHLAFLSCVCLAMGSMLHEDFYMIVILKHEYNKSRPMRHGGKVC